MKRSLLYQYVHCMRKAKPQGSPLITEKKSVLRLYNFKSLWFLFLLELPDREN